MSKKTNTVGVCKNLGWQNRTSHVRDGKKYAGLITDFKRCGFCKKNLPITFFRGNGNYRPDGASYVRHICHDCKKQIGHEAYMAKKNAHEKTKSCECCHSTEHNIEGDHIHGTTEFRGWVCLQCNQGIGKLGDDLDGVLRAAMYLTKGDPDKIIERLMNERGN